MTKPPWVKGPQGPGRRLTGGVCQDCQQRITFVTMTDTGRAVPADPIPVDDGNVCARYSGTKLVGYVISKQRPPESGYTRYAAHFGTCPDRQRPGKPAKPAPAPMPTLFDT